MLGDHGGYCTIGRAMPRPLQVYFSDYRMYSVDRGGSSLAAPRDRRARAGPAVGALAAVEPRHLVHGAAERQRAQQSGPLAIRNSSNAPERRRSPFRLPDTGTPPRIGSVTHAGDRWFRRSLILNPVSFDVQYTWCDPAGPTDTRCESGGCRVSHSSLSGTTGQYRCRVGQYVPDRPARRAADTGVGAQPCGQHPDRRPRLCDRPLAELLEQPWAQPRLE